jgi:dipeptidyl aminopeptidase/acylaminoacyl peptidase
MVVHGQWPSPVSAAHLAQAQIGLGEGYAADGAVYWLQSDPTQAGRTTVMGWADSGQAVDLTPQWDVRTTIHAYGGTPVAIRQSRLCFVDRRTARIWARQADGTSAPVTEPGPQQWGGLAFLNDHQVVAVREDPVPGGQPRDRLVILDLSSGADQVIAEGADFYFSPTTSPTGWIAWMEYDHPGMPWDSTRLVARAPDGTRHTIAHTPGVSALYPQWALDGSLVFLADESGYWNFHRWCAGEVRRLHDHPWDFCLPQWVTTQAPYAVLGERIGCSWWQDGLSRLGWLEADGRLSEWASFGQADVWPASQGIGVAHCAPTDAPSGLYRLDWSAGRATRLAQTARVVLDRPSLPRLVRWPASDPQREVTAWYYPPTPAVRLVATGDEDPSWATAGPAAEAPDSADGAAPPDPADGAAPLLVISHGGPTAYSPAAYSLATQFFTSRGIAVLDVNYAGSAARGRAWRELLNGQWGVLDVRDCLDGAHHLVSVGLADPARLAITGSSAGGLTTLVAMTTSEVFSAGISRYGIADLEALTNDTDKFESHYNDRLVAPYPARRDIYVERSPISHIDQLSCPILILQGAEDPIVPPAQATMMAEAARAKGLPAEVVIYPGEGHGFRQAAHIEDSYRRTITFRGRVWGFTADAGASTD